MITRALRTAMGWVLRALLWLALALIAVAVVAALVFQFWFLPRANDYRDDIAALVQRATGVQVQIGSLKGEWRDWRPHVTLGQVLIRDAQGRDALAIDSIRSEIAWKSIPLLQMRLHTLDVARLSLEVRRDAEGRLFVAGLPLDASAEHHDGLGDWLLQQDSVRLSESSVRWVDERSGAPALELGNVLLELRNRFGRHQVLLQATPPAALGTAFKLEAELSGQSLSRFDDWHGGIEVNMPYVNLGEVKRYVATGGRLEQGAGSLQGRFEFDHGALRQARARVALANLGGRLAADLEPLQLTRVQGAVEISRDIGSLRTVLKDVSFTTPEGLSQSGVSGRFERTVSQSGVLDTELDFGALDLAPVTGVASRLPLSPAVRQRLQTLQPQGRLTALKFSTREQSGRLVKYELSAGFANLAVKALEQFPGFSAMSGTVKATERGGELTLNGRNSQLDLPRIFASPVPIDELAARFAWQTRGDAIDIRVQQLDIANRDAAGKVAGTYRYVPGTAGQADLTATLTRADAAAVWRYAPLVMPGAVREWLKKALVAGRARRADLVLRGNLAEFPFGGGRAGAFEVKVQAEGGILDYVPGWPRIEDIACQLLIRGNALEITQATGRIFNAVLRNAVVTVPELHSTDPRVQVKGDAQGRSADFIRYLKESPLREVAGSALHQFQVVGEGQLKLSLEIPLNHPEASKADGVFNATANRLVLPWDLGSVDQLTGALRISEQGVSARGVAGQYLGGPVRFDLLPLQGGGMQVVASGRAGAAGIARLTRLGWDRQFSGAADWRGRIGLHADHIDLLVESDLTGLASQLPAPLGKAAGEALPLRFERARHESGMGLTRVQLGERVLARYLSPTDQWFDIRTGEVVFNGRSGDSERDGLRVSGRLPELDLDAWNALLNEPAAPAASAGAARSLPTLIFRGLQIDRLLGFARDFGAVTVSGRHTGGVTQLSVEGRALQGEMTWRSQGSGQLAAKMTRLYLPMAQPGAAPVTERLHNETLPAIELDVQEFRLGEREFGRLVLSAVPQGRVWNLRQLNLTAPEGNTQMRGQYDLRGKAPRMSVEVRMDLSDIGGYFARVRLPQGIKRGKAHLEGNLEWNGAPYSLDLPSLVGKVTLEAKQGQFTRIDPGVGKLLGVLSLQSLPRRLTLDFRDVFSQGFAFNVITATSNISGGVATTQDFRMLGPAAAVEIKGGADMLRETQNLRVKVIPGVGDNLTIAGAIFNPAIGLAAYLAQKVFNDPVDKLFSTEYLVTGTWADPQVAKANVEPPVSRGRR